MVEIEWSTEMPFTKESIEAVPQVSGVYELLQAKEYYRYGGQTRTVKFGMSKKDLREELRNHFQRHTAANRLKRIAGEQTITFRFWKISPEEVDGTEKELLKNFEDVYWDLPVLNSTRGYGRGEDAHYTK